MEKLLYYYIQLFLPHTVKQLRKSTQTVSGFHHAARACIGTAVLCHLLIVIQNKILVTKLSINGLSAKVCRKNVHRHEVKLVSIFPTYFLSRETN